MVAVHVPKRVSRRFVRRLFDRQLFGSVLPMAARYPFRSGIQSPVSSLASGAVSGVAAEFIEGDADQTDTPTTTAIDLPATQDAVAVWTGQSFDMSAQALPGMVNLFVDDGTDKREVLTTARQLVIVKVAAGAAVKIGATTTVNNTTPLELRYSVCGLTVPGGIIHPDPNDISDVTETIYTDWNYPEEWQPIRPRLFMPNGLQWFLIDRTSDTRTIVIYIREQAANGYWTPPRQIVLRPGRRTPVFSVTGRVAFCSPDGVSLTITAPGSSYLSTKSGDTLDWTRWWEGVAPSAVEKVIETVDQWAAAVASLSSVSQQRWRVTEALHGQALASITGSFSGKALKIEAYTPTSEPSIELNFGLGTASVALNAAGASTSVIAIEGVKIRNPDANCISTAKCSVRMRHVDVRRDGGTKSAGILSNAEGQAIDVRLFDVHVLGSQNIDAGVDDCFSITTPGGSPVAALMRLIGCHGGVVGRTAGTENMNAITAHNQTGVRAFGGLFEGLGGGPFVTAAGETDPIELHGVWMRKGNGAGGTSENVRLVIGTSTAKVRIAIGCHTEDQGVWLVKTSILNECHCPTGDMEFFSGQFAAEDYVYSLLGNRIIKPDSLGRGLFFRTDSYIAIGNDVVGFQQPLDFSGSSTAVDPVRLVYSNCSYGGTVNVGAQPRPDVANETSVYLGNVTSKFWTASGSSGAVRNLTMDGNLSPEGFQAALTSNGAGGRNSVVAIKNATSAWVASRGSDGTPVADSILTWAGFVASVSGSAAALAALWGDSYGAFDANGRPLYVAEDVKAIGPYVINRSDGVIYPSTG